MTLAQVEPLLDREFLRSRAATCSPHERGAGAARATRSTSTRRSSTGSGPWAWDRHWLLVPLQDGQRRADRRHLGGRPEDRLVPSPTRSRRCGSSRTRPRPRSSRRRHSASCGSSPTTIRSRACSTGAPSSSRLEGEVARAMRYGARVRPRRPRPRRLQGAERPLRPCRRRRGARSVRGVLAESLRKRDEAFRIGGDEFALLLAEATEDGCARGRRARRDGAREAVGRRRAVAAELSASFGVRVLPRARGRRADALPPRRRGAVRGEAQRHRAPLRRAYVVPGLRSGRAEVRPDRARLRRARHLGAGGERALGLARLLDRRRLARRARRPRRRLALHRAPALQGLAPLRRAGDRGDVRRDGRRAERRDLAREHGRLLARPRPARRDGARGDDRHGLRALASPSSTRSARSCSRRSRCTRTRRRSSCTISSRRRCSATTRSGGR